MNVRFVCLANSRRPRGRCVAGIRTDGGGWIRPVSKSSDGGELSLPQCILDNGNLAELLDVIEVEVSGPSPEQHQPENWALENTRWRWVGKLDSSSALRSLPPWVAPGPHLLGSYGDRVSYEGLKRSPASESLVLVEPGRVEWEIRRRPNGPPRARASFIFAGRLYNLAITDPEWEDRLSPLAIGYHKREEAGVGPRDRLFFTISLGGAFNGDCYKFVAAVVLMPG